MTATTITFSAHIQATSLERYSSDPQGQEGDGILEQLPMDLEEKLERVVRELERDYPRWRFTVEEG